MSHRIETLAEGVELHLGDCREVLPTLGRFDAVVTDPPYGINMAGGFSGAGGFSAPIARREYEGEWDKQRPCKQTFEKFLSVGKFHIVWGGNYFSDILPVSTKWFWWDKCQTMPTFSDGELAWTSIPGSSTKKIVCLQAKEKPVEVMRWCIQQLPKECASIFDPFMGSGTTGVAAVKLGRKFTGIEINERYFDIACRRISEALKQPDLFVEPPKPAKQEALGL
jgi:DNA modification methylase